mgnify:CR=1 FL=1
MAISRKVKENQVKELQQLVDNSVAIVLAENKGVTSNDMTKLREKSRSSGDVTLKIVKNRLAKLVFDKSDQYKVLCEDLNNPVLVGFSRNELSSGAQLLGQYAKENDKLAIKAAAIEGVRYGAENISYVMNLPTREQAIAMFASGIRSPLVQFTGSLQELYGQFARVLHAVAEQKQN